MQLEAKEFLYDTQPAIHLLEAFAKNKTFGEYIQNAMLHPAVERPENSKLSRLLVTLSFLIVLCLALSGCSPEQTIHGTTLISTYPLSHRLLIVVLPFAALIFGWLIFRSRTRAIAGILGIIIIIGSVVLSFIYTPSILMNGIVVDNKHFSVHQGYWWDAHGCNLRFTDIESISQQDKDESIWDRWNQPYLAEKEEVSSPGGGVQHIRRWKEWSTLHHTRLREKILRHYLVFKLANRAEERLVLDDLLTEDVARRICQSFENCKLTSTSWHRADFCIEGMADAENKVVPLDPETLCHACESLAKTKGTLKLQESAIYPDNVAIIYDSNLGAFRKLVHPVELEWNVRFTHLNDRVIDVKEVKDFISASTASIRPIQQLEPVPTEKAASLGSLSNRVASPKMPTPRSLHRAEFRVEHPYKYPLELTQLQNLANLISGIRGVLMSHVDLRDQHWVVVIYDNKETDISQVTEGIRDSSLVPFKKLTILDLQDMPISTMPNIVLAGVGKYNASAKNGAGTNKISAEVGDDSYTQGESTITVRRQP